eukprot:2703766-Prorocentrum_lima.AAC.1
MAFQNILRDCWKNAGFMMRRVLRLTGVSTQDESAHVAQAAPEEQSQVTNRENPLDRSDMEWVLEFRMQMNMIQLGLNQLQAT